MKKSAVLIVLFLFSVVSNGQTIQDHYQSGVSKIENKQYNDAIDELSLALEENPRFEEAYLKRAACYVILEDNWKAVEDLNSALGINPRNSVAYYNRGLAYKKLNQLLKSVEDFTMALELDPFNKYAVYNRALVKLRLDDINNACLDLARAADMGVENAAELLKYSCKN
jgi:tetratricopeptide (TPR) repeat protein